VNIMKSNSSFIKVFGDTPINRLWDFLVDSRSLFDYSMTDVCEAAGISWNTLKEIFPSFVREGIVKETRTIGRATMYVLNELHPKSVFMINLHKAISMVFVRGGDLEIEIKITENGKKVPVKFSSPHHQSPLALLTIDWWHAAPFSRWGLA